MSALLKGFLDPTLFRKIPGFRNLKSRDFEISNLRISKSQISEFRNLKSRNFEISNFGIFKNQFHLASLIKTVKHSLLVFIRDQ